MAFAFALPSREARGVERVVFACVAVALLLASAEAAHALAYAVGLARDPILLSYAWTPLLLGLPGAALLLSAALLMTGSLPRERRLAVSAALGLFALGLALAPVPLHDLPDAWQTETAYRVMAALPLLALGSALALLAPRRVRLPAWLGLLALVLHEALEVGAYDLTRRLALPSLPMGWRVALGLSLAGGFGLYVVAFARAARGDVLPGETL